MLDSFMDVLTNIIRLYGWYSLSWFSYLSSFLFGFVLMNWYRNEDESKSELKRNVTRFFCSTFFVFGIATFFVAPFLIGVFFDVETSLSVEMFIVHCISIVLGFVAQFYFARNLSPKFYAFLSKNTKRSELLRNQKTDVRNVVELLPEHVKMPIEQFMTDKNSIFIGFDEQKKPVYLDYEIFKTSHIDVLGTTGAGKGVISQVMLSQAISKGEAVFVLDPKDDEWAASALKQKCDEIGKPFHLVDLRVQEYAFNILEGAEADQIEELFNAAFSLYPKGTDADFYKIKDREAASFMANLAIEEDNRCFIDKLAVAPEAEAMREKAEGFFSSLKELAKVPALSARNGLKLADIVEGGGCVYFVGSVRQSRIILAQRMLMTRLVQLCEDRDRAAGELRPVCVFLDELKYHISKPVVEALGTVRDKGMHMLMAHQAIDDLRDCPADLNGEAVIGAVVENCKIKIAYKVQNPETAEWLAKMSGKIQVDDETRKISRNTGLSEVVDSEKTVRQSERYFIDENMLLNLPVGVCVMYQPNKTPQFASVNRLKVDKQIISYVSANGPSADDYNVSVPMKGGKAIAEGGAASALDNFKVEEDAAVVRKNKETSFHDLEALRQCPFCEEWTATAKALNETFNCESCNAPLQLLENEGALTVATPVEYLKDFDPTPHLTEQQLKEAEAMTDAEPTQELTDSDFDSLFDDFSIDEDKP